ncbi:hypothetical protein EWS82_03520 [Staphylococcus xylosus]|nr:hypothetical protein [Staphylococcus xylosus]
MRSQTIERRFGDAKEQHGMRWTRYRGHDKVSMDTTLICAAMNLKNSNVVSKRANNGLKDHCFLKNNYINKNKQTLRINLRKVCLRSESPLIKAFLYFNLYTN